MADSVDSIQIWIEVPDFPGLLASSRGRVKGVSGHVLAADYGSGRYPSVSFGCKGRMYRRTVHSLVCSAFHGPRPTGLVCAHGDGNCNNPRPENLRWCSRRENEADKLGHGTLQRGEERPNAKLSDADVIAIRAAEGFQAEIGRRFGIGQQHVSMIKNGRIWAHIGSPVVKADNPNSCRRRGESNPRAKLDVKTVLAIREAQGTLHEIARVFGVSWQNIHTIRSRRSWKHI